MTVTSTNSCGAQKATANYTINVDHLPTANTGATPTATICSNATYTISGASAGYGTISWASNNGTGSITRGNTLTPTYTAAAGDAGNAVILTMTVTSTNSCAAQKATANYTINIDHLPAADIGGSADTTICSNKTTTVSTASANFGTISWTSNGSGAIANPTTLTPTYAAVVADAGKSVILTMTVTSNNSCGAQKATATYTVNVDYLPTAIAGGSATICKNDTAYVIGTSASNGSINWTNSGTGNLENGNGIHPIYISTAADAGKVIQLTMTVTNSIGCSSQAVFTVNVISPIADFTFNSISGMAPLTVNFTNNSKNASVYQWTFGDGNSSTAMEPSNTYLKEGIYKIQLIASSNNKCIDSLSKPITVYKWTIPNVFTPNGDGENDYFTVKSIGIINVDGEIYNRWGVKLNEWHSAAGGWDGTVITTELESPPGTYYYIITITDINGGKSSYKGFLELVR